MNGKLVDNIDLKKHNGGEGYANLPEEDSHRNY
jgi:hypothetical protein